MQRKEAFPSPPRREWLWGHLDFIIRGTEGTILEDKGYRSLKLTTHLLRGRLQGVMNRNSSFTYLFYLHVRPRVSCVNAMQDLKSKAFFKSPYIYLTTKRSIN